MVIPKKVNAAEIIPVNISVKYGQTEGRKIFDMINEMRTDSFDAWCWNEDNETKTRYDNLNELATIMIWRELQRSVQQNLHYCSIMEDQTVKAFSVFMRKKVSLIVQPERTLQWDIVQQKQ